MRRLAVFGNPLAHSRSPQIHEAFGRQAGIDLSYERIEAPLDDFVGTVQRFISGGGYGFNVTVPFKREAFDLVDDRDDSAEQSHTVNTVWADGNRLRGSNTDGVGMVTDIESNLGWQMEGRQILIVGAGGAVSGVLPAVLARLPARIDVLNRTHAKAVELAERFGIRAVTADTVSGDYDLVISGSSAGLTEDQLSLPAGIVGPGTHCYDMIYASGTTAFNQWAQRRGAAATSDGLGMLVEQAAAAFSIWFDFEPSTQVVIDELRRSLGDPS